MEATTLNVPEDYLSIQIALNAAESGDTILVQPGTYIENIFWPETNGIKLISAGDSSNTIIDGGGVSVVIVFNGQNTIIDTLTKIKGFSIENGSSEFAGGVLILNASPILQNLSISDNYTSESGIKLDNSQFKTG